MGSRKAAGGGTSVGRALGFHFLCREGAVCARRSTEPFGLSSSVVLGRRSVIRRCHLGPPRHPGKPWLAQGWTRTTRQVYHEPERYREDSHGASPQLAEWAFRVDARKNCLVYHLNHQEFVVFSDMALEMRLGCDWDPGASTDLPCLTEPQRERLPRSCMRTMR